MAQRKTSAPSSRDWLYLRERKLLDALLEQGMDAPDALEYAGFKRTASLTSILRRPPIAREFQARVAEARARSGITAGRVLLELAGMAFSTPDSVFDEGPDGEPVMKRWKDIPPIAKRAMRKVKVRERVVPRGRGNWEVVREVEIEFHGKTDPLKQLGIRLGLWKDEGSEADRQSAEDLYTAMREMLREEGLPATGGSPPPNLAEGPDEEDEDEFLRPGD